MVSNQHKSLGIKQWSYADRLADLRGFIYDAEIKPAMGKNGMFDSHTGGSHYKLVREKRSTLLTQALNIDWKLFAVFCFTLDISPPCCKAAPAVKECEPPSSEHFPPCMKESQDEPDGMKEGDYSHRILETPETYLKYVVIKLQLQNLKNSETVMFML